jgi:hypothetical protein
MGGEQGHGDDQPNNGAGQQLGLAALEATGASQDVVEAFLTDQVL